MNIRLILAHSQEIDCAICLDLIDNQSKAITGCNHVFHDSCLEQIMNNRCPLCRSELVSSDEFVQQVLTRSQLRAREDLNQHMIALREQNATLHAQWQSTRDNLHQEQTEEQDRMNQEYLIARQRLDEQFYTRRMQAHNHATLQQAISQDALAQDRLNQVQERALNEMNNRYWDNILQLDQEYLDDMNAHEVQINFLLGQLSRMVEMQTIGRQRLNVNTHNQEIVL